MAGLGRLVIDLDARITRFERAMSRAERMTQKKMRRIKGIASKAAGSIGAILGTALGAGLLRGSKQAADALSNISDQADKLGLTTDKLQTLRFAAEQAGVGVKSFDVGFQRFTRRVADAAAGNKQLAATFDQFNIKLSDGEGRLKTNVDLFYEFSDAIARSDDQGKRILKTFQLFDTEGVDLVRLMQQGSSAIKQFESDAESMGAVINSSVIREADKASKQLAAMSRVVSAITTPAMAQLAPVMVDLARAFAIAANWVSKFFDYFRDTSQKQNIQGLEQRLTELQERAVKLGTALQDTGNLRGGQIAKMRRRYSDLRDEIDSVIARLKELRGDGSGGVPPIGGTPDEQKGTVDAWKSIRTAMIRQQEILQAQVQGQKDYINLTARRLQIEHAVADASERLGRSLTNHEKEFIRVSLETQQKYQDILDKRAQAAKEKVDQFEQFGIQMARNMQSVFADYLFNPFEGSLNDMLTSFSDMIRKMVAQIAAEKLLSGLAGSFAGGGFASNLAGFFQGPRKLAAGGNVAAGESVIVGDGGEPELFTPSVAGTVTPMSQMGGLNMTINIQGDDVARAGRTGNQLGLDIGRGFNLAQRRNG